MFRLAWPYALLVVAVGCGPTAEQVVSRHRPAMLVLKAKLERLSAQLPPPGGFSQRSAKLEPPLVLIEDNPASNCQSLMAAELQGKEAKFDLLLNNHLSTALYWTENPPSSGGDAAFMEKTFSAALAARYLVVHRVEESQLPTAVSGETFVGGDVPIEGFVFDLESEQLVAAYQFVARPAEAVDYQVRSNESETERLEAGARSTVWTDARKKLAAKLAETTVGTVVIH